MKLIDAITSKQFGTIHKPTSYFAAYDFCFRDFKDKEIQLLEIGVSEGGSLAAWQQYFPHARIVGIDRDESCKRFEGGNIRVFIGDQTDVDFLKKVNEAAGGFDIIIDDGGHTMRQQIVSFNTLFPLLNDNGVYVIEDLHTSYWPEFYDQRKTTIQFLKARIDDLNYWARLHPRTTYFKWLRAKIAGLKQRLGMPPRKWGVPQPRNFYQKSICSMFFADSIVFLFKGEVTRDQSPRM